MNHESFQRKVNELVASGALGEAVSDRVRVGAHCRLASLVRRRAVVLGHDGRSEWYGYGPSRVGGGDGGLWDAEGHLLRTLEQGWGGQLWSRVVGTERADILASSLLDVEHSLALCMRGSLLHLRAWSLIEALRRREDLESVFDRLRFDVVGEPRIREFAAAAGVLSEESDRDRDVARVRQAFGALRAGLDRDALPSNWSDRHPDAPIGIREFVEDAVNWRFEACGPASYWQRRTELCARALGLDRPARRNIDLVSPAFAELPTRFPVHPIREATRSWLELPREVADAYWHSVDRGLFAASAHGYRMALIECLDELFRGFCADAIPRHTTLRALWRLGLPEGIPSPGGPVLDDDL